MEYSFFKKTLDSVRSVDSFHKKANDIGINLMYSPISNAMDTIFDTLITMVYGDEGKEWINWYLYELPYLDNDSVTHAYDKHGNPLDFKDDEKLWEFLEKEYKI